MEIKPIESAKILQSNPVIAVRMFDHRYGNRLDVTPDIYLLDHRMFIMNMISPQAHELSSSEEDKFEITQFFVHLILRII